MLRNDIAEVVQLLDMDTTPAALSEIQDWAEARTTAELLALVGWHETEVPAGQEKVFAMLVTIEALKDLTEVGVPDAER